MVESITEDGRCFPKIYWSHDELERDRRIDAIAEILERSGLSYVEARRTAKEILRLPKQLAPRLTIEITPEQALAHYIRRAA